MTRRIDDLARDAAGAVRETTDRIDLQGGADEVRRRVSRRALTPVVAGVVVLVALAVPAIGWLVDARDPVGVEVADAPDATEPTADPDDAGDPAVAEDIPDDPAPAPGDDGQMETDAPTDPTATDDGPSALGEFGTDTVASEGFPAGGTDVALLTDVRVAGQDGFDRFVLEFDATEMSPYQVGYVDGPVRADGSGDVVDVGGSAFLEVRLTAASGVAFDVEAPDGYRITYDGPERVAGADTTTIVEAVRTGDFEATLTWTIGLDDRAPFAVTVLESPLRLVIDVETS